MSDAKINSFSGRPGSDYEQQLSRRNGDAAVNAPLAKRPARVPTNGQPKVGSWDAYRNWLTKVQVPSQKRSVPEAALFSWKGYRSWAEKIRRDWDADPD